jgi:hypothetical protein
MIAAAQMSEFMQHERGALVVVEMSEQTGRQDQSRLTA